MPSYKITAKSEYSGKLDRKTSSTSYYKLHTDSLKSVMDSVLERRKGVINQVNINENKKIIEVKIEKISD